MHDTSLSSTGITFFDSNAGSKFSNTDVLTFPYKGLMSKSIDSLLPMQDGNFSVEWKLKWDTEERNVLVGLEVRRSTEESERCFHSRWNRKHGNFRGT